MLPIPGVSFPKLSLRTIAEILTGVALLAALAFQTVRIEGFKVWPIHVKGFIEKLEDSRQETKDVQNAFDQTVAAYRLKAAEIKAQDEANLRRVQAETAANDKERRDAYANRIAAANATAARLRDQLKARANSSGESGTSMSGVSASTDGIVENPYEAGFSVSDRLIATEQAIQLDELIKWVKHQASIPVNNEESSNGEATNLDGSGD